MVKKWCQIQLWNKVKSGKLKQQKILAKFFFNRERYAINAVKVYDTEIREQLTVIKEINEWWSKLSVTSATLYNGVLKDTTTYDLVNIDTFNDKMQVKFIKYLILWSTWKVRTEISD